MLLYLFCKTYWFTLERCEIILAVCVHAYFNFPNVKCACVLVHEYGAEHFEMDFGAEAEAET